ncbi:MAG: CHAT domain-containing protein, partial [Candidatus Heimdallarchaeota archaeon]|nr:CHAT domain-containing protein [Candidatus Heimdallarchaeota archaeon]
SLLDLKEEQQIFKDLGTKLFTRLEIPDKSKDLLIIPEGNLSNMPWLAVLHKGETLAEKHSLTISPSLRHHLNAASLEINSDRIEIFVGSDGNLIHKRKELSILKKQSVSEIVLHDPCTHDDFPTYSEADLWHYAGHALLRRDNPFYSYLVLDDGPFFAVDFQTRRNKVRLITLAACLTGFQTTFPGEESTGLVRALLEMGARNVLGSHWEVSDKTTSLWMNEFYKNIFNNEIITEAVRKASLTVKEKYPSAYSWAAFSVFGA